VGHGKQSGPRAELDSANYYLTSRDLDKFLPGRAMDDVLKDVQWRGDFELAATYKGNNACSIMYFLLPRGATIPHPWVAGYLQFPGEWLWAIFIDGKFAKFVKPPPPLPEEVEEYYDRAYERNMRRPRPIKVGDTRFLIRAVNSPPVNIVDLEKKISDTPPARSHVDPGLTAAFLVSAPALLPKLAAEHTEIERQSKRNAALRDQFNASRLRIRMTASEVNKVLRATPLESGKVEAGSYGIYGSNESFDLDEPLHFSNIVVLFKEGELIGIDGVPAGHKWRRNLGARFVDLPTRGRGAGTKANEEK
jgi:hypothetical protein